MTFPRHSQCQAHACWRQALAVTPIMFLNLVALVIFWILSSFAATERAKARLWQNQFMSYGSKVRPAAHSGAAGVN